MGGGPGGNICHGHGCNMSITPFQPSVIRQTDPSAVVTPPPPLLCSAVTEDGPPGAGGGVLRGLLSGQYELHRRPAGSDRGPAAARRAQRHSGPLRKGQG